MWRRCAGNEFLPFLYVWKSPFYAFVFDIFTEKRILGWQFCCRCYLKVSIHCCRADIVSSENSAVILVFFLLYTMCLFLWLLLTHFSITGFKQCDYDMPWCLFFSCFLCLEFLQILGCVGLLLSLHLKIFQPLFFFNYFFCSSHSPSFRHYSYA